jgi:L-erythro-3,5-diaminohexanoate dehydrogenase
LWDIDPAVLGTWRSLEPLGALPHLARRLDAVTEPNEYEIEIDVDLLNIDALSYRQLAQSCGRDPERIANAVADIVNVHGKMQNPATGSGGVARGVVRAIGSLARADVRVDDLVVPLVSLIALPLQLKSVGPVNPDSPQVPVRGRAIITGRMPVALVPADLVDAALTALDVYPVASYVRQRAVAGDHVAILGAGPAGLLGAVAAADVVGPTGHISVLDVDVQALKRLAEVVPAATAFAVDATNAVACATALRDRRLPPSDLTLACTSAKSCEGTALLLTANTGTVLFFSTATSFAAAALGSDPIGVGARLELSNGVTPDHGTYTFDLLRRNPALRKLFGGGAT